MNIKIQAIEDYLKNNNAAINIQSYCDEGNIEYEACLELHHGIGEAVEQICEAYSNESIGDVLEQLSIALTTHRKGPEKRPLD